MNLPHISRPLGTVKIRAGEKTLEGSVQIDEGWYRALAPHIPAMPTADEFAALSDADKIAALFTQVLALSKAMKA